MVLTTIGTIQLEHTMSTVKILLQYRLFYMHNQRSRINCLPPEVLSRIFLHLQDPFVPLPSPEDIVDPPPAGRWHRVNSVCRHWRQVALDTTELWTTIRVCGRTMQRFDERYWSCQWSPLSLSRSGVLPLTIDLDTLINEPLVKRDISRLVDEADRIQELRCTGFMDLEVLKEILSTARRLKTLLVIHGWSAAEDRVLKILSCELPELRTLSVVMQPIWQAWSFRNLRHLCFIRQKWDSNAVRGFFAILQANVHLEELLLFEITVSEEALDNTAEFIKQSSPLRVPRLKRLFVHEWHTDGAPIFVYPMITVLSQSLELPTSCTRFNILITDTYATRLDNFDRREAFAAVERLFISPMSLIGTDGVSACIIQRCKYDTRILRSIPLLCVRELWLGGSSDADGYQGTMPFTLNAITDMQNVVKLVLVRDVSFWIYSIGDSFPALKELHILMQSHGDGRDILRFLKNRKRKGLQVDTLRFIGDPKTQAGQAFMSWKRSSWKFARPTGQVIFEEIRGYKNDEELLSERLGLPENCKNPLPINNVWQPWSHYSILDG